MNRLRFEDSLRATLAHHLERLTLAPAQAGALKRAAVCMIVTGDANGEAALLLTRRAARLSTHSGQYALPGGQIGRAHV